MTSAAAEIATPIGEEEVDGRRLRREHNRQAVLNALVELFGQGSYQPSASDIAERAGISPRSLFRYFDDVDDLNRAAIDGQLASARPLLEVSVRPDAPMAERIECLAEARVRLFETIQPAAKAARVCAHRHAIVARQIRESRSYLRHQLQVLFGPELQGDRATLLAGLDALCSFETYDLMRSDQGRSRADTVSALTAAMTALLTFSGGSP
jgi:TetR/AcrR family transcriptional regulator of autoinduction and epiphytic fitness